MEKKPDRRRLGGRQKDRAAKGDSGDRAAAEKPPANAERKAPAPPRHGCQFGKCGDDVLRKSKWQTDSFPKYRAQRCVDAAAHASQTVKQAAQVATAIDRPGKRLVHATTTPAAAIIDKRTPIGDMVTATAA